MSRVRVQEISSRLVVRRRFKMEFLPQTLGSDRRATAFVIFMWKNVNFCILLPISSVRLSKVRMPVRACYQGDLLPAALPVRHLKGFFSPADFLTEEQAPKSSKFGPKSASMPAVRTKVRFRTLTRTQRSVGKPGFRSVFERGRRGGESAGGGCLRPEGGDLSEW